MKKKKDYSISHFITKSKKQKFIEYKLDSFVNHILKIKFTRKIEKLIKYIQYGINEAIVTPCQIFNMWKGFANDISTNESKLNIFITVLQLTLKDCIIIYLRAFFQVVIILVSFLIFLFLSFYLLRFFIVDLLIKNLNEYIPNLISGISKDAWLTFTGNMFCGLMTIFGIAITLKHERKRDRLNNIQNSKPIIIIEQSTEISKRNKKKIKGSCSLNFQDLMEENSSPVIEVKCPFLVFENVGFNRSLNIEVHFETTHMTFASFSGVASIDTKEKILYGISISFISDNLKNFDRVLVKTEKERWFHADLLKMRMMFKLEINDIELVASNPAYIEITYQDVYGTIYKQKHSGRLYIAKVSDRYFSCALFQNYANSIICNKLK